MTFSHRFTLVATDVYALLKKIYKYVQNKGRGVNSSLNNAREKNALLVQEGFPYLMSIWYAGQDDNKRILGDLRPVQIRGEEKLSMH